jgi:hypothetical protein
MPQSRRFPGLESCSFLGWVNLAGRSPQVVIHAALLSRRRPRRPGRTRLPRHRRNLGPRPVLGSATHAEDIQMVVLDSLACRAVNQPCAEARNFVRGRRCRKPPQQPLCALPREDATKPSPSSKPPLCRMPCASYAPFSCCRTRSDTACIRRPKVRRLFRQRATLPRARAWP